MIIALGYHGVDQLQALQVLSLELIFQSQTPSIQHKG